MSDSVRFSQGRRLVSLALLHAIFPRFARSESQFPLDVQDTISKGRPEETRLPNGKRQTDEILKAEFKKNLDDVRELNELTQSLQRDMEKEDRFVLSLGTLKKLDDVEKLTKRIRNRLKRF